MPRQRAVIRDDGKRYRSMSDAAQDLLRESGMKPDKNTAHSMAGSISNACGRKRGRRSAYGHDWRYADERPREEIERENEELKREVEVLRCMLEALTASR